MTLVSSNLILPDIVICFKKFPNKWQFCLDPRTKHQRSTSYAKPKDFVYCLDAVKLADLLRGHENTSLEVGILAVLQAVLDYLSRTIKKI
jgi:hypothetical protein